MRRAAIVWMAAAAGCGAPTAVELSISVDAKAPAPSSLRVALWGDGPIGNPHALSLDGKSLPGTLLVLPPSAETRNFRLRVDGLDAAGALTSQAAAATPVVAGSVPIYPLTLTAGALLDGDGDGVPDAVDDCPALADPLQDCPGGPADLSGPQPDLSAPSCPPGALLCEDWESGGTAGWTPSIGGPLPAQLAVDGTRPHRGLLSLHGSAPVGSMDAGSNDSTESLIHSFAPASSGLLALRTFLYTEDPPGDFDLYFFFDSETNPSYSVGGASGGNWVVTHPSVGADLHGPDAVPLGRWVCVELRLTISSSGPNGRVQLLVDGATEIDTPYDTSGTMIDAVTYGIARDTGAQPWSVWLDDLVVATAPIGCN